MNAFNYAQKLTNLIFRKWLGFFYLKHGNIYDFGPTTKGPIRSVLFYFPVKDFMHPGDHVFFEPAIRHLVDCGLDVKVCPVSNMKFYFQKYGALDRLPESKPDLLVSRIEFYSQDLLSSAKRVILFDTADANTKYPLCLDIAQKISKIANTQIPSNEIRPSIIEPDTNVLQSLGLLPERNYILFNNYVDSRIFSVRDQHLRIFRSQCRTLSKTLNCKVVHIGSAEDKKRDKSKYDFVDIDLRGQTTIKNLFELLFQPNVLACVSYDTLLMHIAAVYNKPSHIIFRGRFFKKNADFVYRCVFPPFYTDRKLIHLIDEKVPIGNHG